jgi:hypothetical protein
MAGHFSKPTRFYRAISSKLRTVLTERSPVQWTLGWAAILSD